jgi:hypothetical protein
VGWIGDQLLVEQNAYETFEAKRRIADQLANIKSYESQNAV